VDILSFIVPLFSNTEFLVLTHTRVYNSRIGLTKNPGTEFCAGVVQLSFPGTSTSTSYEWRPGEQNLKIVKIFKRDENLFDYF
jgi:hypothetical protein